MIKHYLIYICMADPIENKAVHFSNVPRVLPGSLNPGKEELGPEITGKIKAIVSKYTPETVLAMSEEEYERVFLVEGKYSSSSLEKHLSSIRAINLNPIDGFKRRVDIINFIWKLSSEEKEAALALSEERERGEAEKEMELLRSLYTPEEVMGLSWGVYEADFSRMEDLLMTTLFPDTVMKEDFGIKKKKLIIIEMIWQLDSAKINELKNRIQQLAQKAIIEEVEEAGVLKLEPEDLDSVSGIETGDSLSRIGGCIESNFKAAIISKNSSKAVIFDEKGAGPFYKIPREVDGFFKNGSKEESLKTEIFFFDPGSEQKDETVIGEVSYGVIVFLKPRYRKDGDVGYYTFRFTTSASVTECNSDKNEIRVALSTRLRSKSKVTQEDKEASVERSAAAHR